MKAKKSNTKEITKVDNDDYERNHALILDAIMTCLKEEGKFPTYQKLAEMTKLHYQTIRNHSKDFNWNDFLPKYKLYSPKLMENILSTARKNSSSQRLGAEILGMVKGETSNQFNFQINVNLPEFLNESD